MTFSGTFSTTLFTSIETLRVSKGVEGDAMFGSEKMPNLTLRGAHVDMLDSDNYSHRQIDAAAASN